jgi:hypothetical protein
VSGIFKNRVATIRCLVHAHVVAHTPLKATPGRASEERSNRAFPQSHPRLMLFQGRGVQADAGDGDGTSSGGVTKKQLGNFGHHPSYFDPLFSSCLGAQIQIFHFPLVDLFPFRDPR